MKGMNIFTGESLSMTLKEITDLLGVRHNNAVPKVIKMSEESSFGPLLKTSIAYNDSGQTIDTYSFDKRQSLAVAAKLNTALLMRVIDRWQELEQGVSLNLPKTLPEALRAYADQVDKTAKLALERDRAIQTKHLIDSNRAATACGRLGAKAKENKKLKKENSVLKAKVGIQEDWKQAKAIPWLEDFFYLTKTAYQQVGRKLSALSAEMGVAPVEIEDSQYGKIKAYHKEVISELNDRLKVDADLLAKYRKEAVL